MDATPTFWLEGQAMVFERPLDLFSRIFLHIPTLWWVTGTEFIFGKTYGKEINLYVCNFQIFIEL